MAEVVAVHLCEQHGFSKRAVPHIDLVAGVGVLGDVHAGPFVQHLSRVAADPTQPNLRQVHLIAAELFDLLADVGHHVKPGELGENITTAGLDLHSLAVGTTMVIGDDVILAVTGLRNPCNQIERFQPGLLSEVAQRSDDGTLVRRAGVMAVVILGGTVRIGDRIRTATPPGAPRPLDRV